MRTKQTDFKEVSRGSMKRDFNRNKKPYKKPELRRDDGTRRVAEINPESFYAKYARFIVGKKVQLHYGEGGKVMVSFIFDEDRIALNKAAGWSNDKTEYLLDGVKFKQS